MSARDLTPLEWGIIVGSAPMQFLWGLVVGLLLIGELLKRRVGKTWDKLFAECEAEQEVKS